MVLHNKEGSGYLLLAYADSETAFEQWTEPDEFEAAHKELFGAMFLEPEYVDRYESADTISAL